MHYHCLPIAVGLRRRPGAVGKVWKRIRPLENRTRHGSTLSLAPVTRNAATLADPLSIPHIRTCRIVERLCGNKQRATKKHDKPHDERTRRPRQGPEEESAQSRFVDATQSPCLLQWNNSFANRGRLVPHSPSGFLHFDDQKTRPRPLRHYRGSKKRG